MTYTKKIRKERILDSLVDLDELIEKCNDARVKQAKNMCKPGVDGVIVGSKSSTKIETPMTKQFYLNFWIRWWQQLVRQTRVCVYTAWFLAVLTERVQQER
jgi:hypothetical protein